MYATGVRVAEPPNSMLGMLILRNKLIRVTGKRRKERIVRSGEPALELCSSTWCAGRPSVAGAISLRDERALFLNYQGTRITTRSVGRVVEKYIRICAGMHNISRTALRIPSHSLTG